MFERYTEAAKQTIVFAKGEAAQLGSPEIGPEHILFAILRDEKITDWLMKGLSVSEIRGEVLAHASRRHGFPPPIDLPLSRQSREVLRLAEEQATIFRQAHVSNSHILLGLLSIRDSPTAQVLQAKGLSLDEVRLLVAGSSRGEEVAPRNINQLGDTSGVESEMSAHPHLKRLIESTIVEFKELSSRGEQRNALRLLDSIMNESVPERSLRIRHLAPFAAATARSLGDFTLVKQYCELRLANDPADLMALYGMAECLMRQGNPEEARSYVAKCYELSAVRGDMLGQEVTRILDMRFPEWKMG